MGDWFREGYWCLKVKIALVTFDFDTERRGGISSVCKNIIESLIQEFNSQIEIISFSNSKYDLNSISFSRPKSYRNKITKSDGNYRSIPITRVSSIGSEFEFLRYRRRKELSNFFRSYDLIIVVTGILQFANVIPKIKVPVIVQCATRLKWERESQYSSMSKFKKFFLKLQLPFLALQERKVLNSNLTILVENSKMKEWITSKSSIRTEMWYPGAGAKVSKFISISKPHRNGHFVSVGRLDESRKGWNRLLLAYKQAIDMDVSLPDLVIIGSGSFSVENQRLLDQLTPHYPIRILGKLSDHERDSKIQSASFFLQTSFEEGLGLAALESLRFGVPLICSETDGSREYVRDGISGKLVPQGDLFVNEFAKAIIQSQIWDYEKLSESSKNLFDSVFAEELSKERLLKIISTTLSWKL